MPVPESAKKDMGACIRFFRKDKPDWPSDQRVAACLQETGQSNKSKEPKK